MEDLDITTVVTSAILVILFSIVLVMNSTGSKFNFVTILSSLMIVTNLAAIAVITENIQIYKIFEANLAQGSYKNTMFWVTALAISCFVRDLTFNIAHWMFAFEYYKIS